MKAIVVDKNSADGLDYSIQKKIFEENGIEFVLEDCQTEDEIIEKCKDADALLVMCCHFIQAMYRTITNFNPPLCSCLYINYVITDSVS